MSRPRAPSLSPRPPSSGRPSTLPAPIRAISHWFETASISRPWAMGSNMHQGRKQAHRSQENGEENQPKLLLRTAWDGSMPCASGLQPGQGGDRRRSSDPAAMAGRHGQRGRQSQQQDGQRKPLHGDLPALATPAASPQTAAKEGADAGAGRGQAGRHGCAAE